MTMSLSRESSFFELRKETDRSVAIVGVSWLDDLLEDCLSLYLRQPNTDDMDADKTIKQVLNEMFNPEGPLGSFSAKFKMAFLLNVIGPITFMDLKTINDIRRKFAHLVKTETPNREIKPLSFLVPPISDMAKNLKSKTSKRVMVMKRPDASPGAIAFISAVDAIADGLRSHISVAEDGREPDPLP